MCRSSSILKAAGHKGYDRDRIVAIFRELEFRTLLDRLEKQLGGLEGELYVSEAKVAPETETIIVDTPEALEALVKRLKQGQGDRL